MISLDGKDAASMEIDRTVLHIVGALNRGGTETWLVSLFRELADTSIKNEVVVQVPMASGGYEEDVKMLGIPIHLVPRDLSWPIRLFRLFRALNRNGAVHSHRDEFSAFVLVIAWAARVPVRIAHYHAGPAETEVFSKRMYRSICKLILRFVATERIAVSEKSQRALFGTTVGHSQVLYCGLDLKSSLFSEVERLRIRNELGIMSDTVTLVHVGAMRAVKNHEFLIEVFCQFRSKYRHDAQLILVGDGALRDEIQVCVNELGLADSVHILGVRSDVSAILSAADAFVFPSLHEGLGLAAVEAQVAGLPIIISDVIPEETTVIDGLVSRISVRAGREAWADTIEAAIQAKQRREVDLLQFERFDLEGNAKAIMALYDYDR